MVGADYLCHFHLVDLTHEHYRQQYAQPGLSLVGHIMVLVVSVCQQCVLTYVPGEWCQKEIFVIFLRLLHQHRKVLHVEGKAKLKVLQSIPALPIITGRNVHLAGRQSAQHSRPRSIRQLPAKVQTSFNDKLWRKV